MNNRIKITFSNNNFKLSAGHEYYKIYNNAGSNSSINAFYNDLISETKNIVIPNKLYINENNRNGWTINKNNANKLYDDSYIITSDNVVLYPSYNSIYKSINITENGILSKTAKDFIYGYKEKILRARIKDNIENVNLSVFNTFISSFYLNHKELLSSTSTSCITLKPYVMTDNKDVKNYHDYIISNDCILSYEYPIKSASGFKIPLREQAPDILENSYINYRFELSDNAELSSYDQSNYSYIKYYDESMNNDSILQSDVYWWPNKLSSGDSSIDYSKEYQYEDPATAEKTGLHTLWNELIKNNTNTTLTGNTRLTLVRLGMKGMSYPSVLSVGFNIDNLTKANDVSLAFDSKFINSISLVKTSIPADNIEETINNFNINVKFNSRVNYVNIAIIKLKTDEILKNDFNGSIDIEYSISSKSNIKLWVYHVLHKEIFYFDDLSVMNDRKLVKPIYNKWECIPNARYINYLYFHNQDFLENYYEYKQSADKPKFLDVLPKDLLHIRDDKSLSPPQNSNILSTSYDINEFRKAYHYNSIDLDKNIYRSWIHLQAFNHLTDNNGIIELYVKVKNAITVEIGDYLYLKSLGGDFKALTNKNGSYSSIIPNTDKNAEFNKCPGIVYYIKSPATNPDTAPDQAAEVDLLNEYLVNTNKIEIFYKIISIPKEYRITFAGVSIWFKRHTKYNVCFSFDKIRESEYLKSFSNNTSKLVTDINFPFNYYALLDLNYFNDKYLNNIKTAKLQLGQDNFIDFKGWYDETNHFVYRNGTMLSLVISNDMILRPIYNIVHNEYWPKFNIDAVINDDKKIISNYFPIWTISRYRVTFCCICNPDDTIFGKSYTFDLPSIDKNYKLTDLLNLVNESGKANDILKMFGVQPLNSVFCKEHERFYELNETLVVKSNITLYTIYEEAKIDTPDNDNDGHPDAYCHVKAFGTGVVDETKTMYLNTIYNIPAIKKFYDTNPYDDISVQVHGRYWQAAAGGAPQAYIDGISFRFISTDHGQDKDLKISLHSENGRKQSLTYRLYQGDGHHAWVEWNPDKNDWDHFGVDWSSSGDAYINAYYLPAFNPMRKVSLKINETSNIVREIWVPICIGLNLGTIFEDYPDIIERGILKKLVEHGFDRNIIKWQSTNDIEFGPKDILKGDTIKNNDLVIYPVYEPLYSITISAEKINKLNYYVDNNIDDYNKIIKL